MLSHNADPHLLNLLMNADLEQINQALILRLVTENCGFKHRIDTLESQNEEILQKLDNLENIYNEIPYLRHLVDQNEELQNLVDFYCPPD
ncbi:hypothetical protein [Calothrix sp. PCC 6303]|uniref:hypothetical protein n=1 Tax=Calothrix sp. PCC 6303 TaxID=1170562 RepID=UPI0002A038AB|nr:hypothetical protein [Calothrix sp. PCC 6303]AFZ00739.1 hypothetical protein Cal6303_1700 [Calothrix sp. PCC 6303]